MGEIVLADGEIALSGSCGREDSRFVKQTCSPIVAANRVRQSYNMFFTCFGFATKTNGDH